MGSPVVGDSFSDWDVEHTFGAGIASIIKKEEGSIRALRFLIRPENAELLSKVARFAVQVVKEEKTPQGAQ